LPDGGAVGNLKCIVLGNIAQLLYSSSGYVLHFTGFVSNLSRFNVMLLSVFSKLPMQLHPFKFGVVTSSIAARRLNLRQPLSHVHFGRGDSHYHHAVAAHAIVKSSVLRGSAARSVTVLHVREDNSVVALLIQFNSRLASRLLSAEKMYWEKLITFNVI
jgi:hypothetical protein